MKCPNCGRELAEGLMYCEICGGEVRIVPDFEPEFESEIHDTLSGLAEEIDTSDESVTRREETTTQKPKQGYFSFEKVKNMPYFSSILLAGSIFLIIILILAGTQFYQYFSYNYQVKEALDAGDQKDYVKATAYLERALEISNEDNGAEILLADYYHKNGQIQEAIALLNEYIVKWKEPIDGYRLLISIYEEQSDYQSINDLLLLCNDKETLNQYQKYMALPPEFSLKESVYYEIIPLKILGNSKGTIYYTLDGSEPTKNSKEYKAPIFLDIGTYNVKAFFVNSYGIKSAIAQQKITIAATKPYPPEVNQYTGTYKEATEIEVNVQEDCEVYYTTDGSEPTQASILYTAPIKMPLGASYFKFIAMSKNGAFGEVTERRYQLFLEEAEIATQQAINITLKFQVDTHFIIDYEGHALNQTGQYRYTCNTAINVNNITYYLIEESYVDPTGTQTRTGNQFAVDIMTGDIYKAEMSILNKYTVTPFN